MLDEEEKRIFLTSAGMDATNTPASMFVSSIPKSIRDLVLIPKRDLWKEERSGVVVATSRVLEARMQHLLHRVIEDVSDAWDCASDDLPKHRWRNGLLELP